MLKISVLLLLANLNTCYSIYMIKIGQIAPLDIEVLNEDSKPVNLSQYLNNDYLLLYFYPKDDTPGCTTEACEIRDFNKDISELGVKIVGVSKDSVKSHLKFKEKYSLNFELLSDQESTLQQAFGVWQLKKMMGREYMGTVRSTFLINRDGVIVNVWENVKAQGHAKEVFEYIKSLKTGS